MTFSRSRSASDAAASFVLARKSCPPFDGSPRSSQAIDIPRWLRLTGAMQTRAERSRQADFPRRTRGTLLAKHVRMEAAGSRGAQKLRGQEMNLNEFPRVGDALLRRLDVPVPRYRSYPTAPVWT